MKFPKDDIEYVTVIEAALLMDIKETTLRTMISQNRFPSEKLGTMRLIKKTDVDAYNMKK